MDEGVQHNEPTDTNDPQWPTSLTLGYWPENDSRSDTPLFDHLATKAITSAIADTNEGTDSAHPPADTRLAVVLQLFTRIKAIEHSDGRWSGAHVVELLTEWFGEFGIDAGDDEITAAQALRMPVPLARDLTAYSLDETSLVIHVRSQRVDPLDTVRPFLTALVRSLGNGSSASVFDVVGDQVAHIVDPTSLT